MLTSSLLLAVLTTSPATVQTSDQAFLAILAETKVMRMAGMPLMKDMPDLPPGFTMPNMPGMEFVTGEASRILNVRLWSPKIAPDNAAANIAPPSGLKQGPKLDLDLYRPGITKTAPQPRGEDFDPDKNPEFTLKIYWGSSETVKEGQPKIIRWADLAPDQKRAMKEQAKDARAASDYFYKEDWTTGYWPTQKQPGKIAKDASLVGKYALTTNYTGNVEIEAPSNVDFLAALQIVKPDLEKKIDLKKSMKFEWKPIPNALGQFAAIMGLEGKSTMILWSSSEVFNDSIMGDMGFLQMAEVRSYVGQTIFMPGESTKVDVPAGIFKDVDISIMNMVAYGPGAALDKAQPLPRIQTKSTAMIMLGGKKMKDID